MGMAAARTRSTMKPLSSQKNCSSASTAGLSTTCSINMHSDKRTKRNNSSISGQRTRKQKPPQNLHGEIHIPELMHLCEVSSTALDFAACSRYL